MFCDSHNSGRTFFFSKASVVHVRAGSAVRRRARHKVAETTTTAEAMSTPIARGRIERTLQPPRSAGVMGVDYAVVWPFGGSANNHLPAVSLSKA